MKQLTVTINAAWAASDLGPSLNRRKLDLTLGCKEERIHMQAVTETPTLALLVYHTNMRTYVLRRASTTRRMLRDL